MNRDWINNLKIGDHVFIVSGTIFNKRTELKKVTGITPTGMIKVGTELFNANGWKRGDHESLLRQATTAGVKKYREDKVIKKALSLMVNTKELRYSQAKNIIDILENNA